jgi:hypothetical protein
VGAVIPSIQVYVGKLIVDQLVYLIQDRTPQALYDVLFFVGIEIAFGVVLYKLDWIFVAILAGTMIPVILLEFRQSILTYRWQTSWSRWWRHAWYYRWVLAAYDYLQEFRIFRLRPLFINRYLEIGG